MKKPRYDTKAVVRRTSPQSLLSCCLKLCTASAHLTFSEASPLTYSLREQSGEMTHHPTGYLQTPGLSHTERTVHVWGQKSTNIVQVALLTHEDSHISGNKPLLCAGCYLGCGWSTVCDWGFPERETNTAQLEGLWRK